MTKKLYLLFFGLLAAGLIAAGCGSDNKDNSKTTAPATSKPSGGGGGGGGGGGATGGAPSGAVKSAVDACKQSVNAVPQLSAGTKKDLEGICEKAASGDAAAVQKATKEVCKKIVGETAPAGPARDQALKACDTATTTP